MLKFPIKDGMLAVFSIREDIVRVVYTTNNKVLEPSDLIVPAACADSPAELINETDLAWLLCAGKLQIQIDKATGACVFSNYNTGKLYLTESGKELIKKEVIHYTTGGESPVIERVKTVDGERNFIRNLKPEAVRKAYSAKLYFEFKEEEAIHGLGQAEDGIYDYRHHVQYLYQHNMRTPIPFFVSTEGYGIFLDCLSLMTFCDDESESYISLDTLDQLDYYFLAGETLDEIIGGYRFLTGRASMLPRWAFGYVQSREAYRTDKELVDTVCRYRNLDIPIDCIVLDWNSWKPDYWGEKRTDPERFPNLSEALSEIHKMNVHTMVSVWPNMNSCTDNYKELSDAGCMLNDLATYDAFSEEGRRIYFKQANEGLFSKGFDSWWCDSTEPFSGPDWNGAKKRNQLERFQLVGGEHKHYIDEARANAYSFYHALGMYENQRRLTEDRRMVNLTRSGYAGIQRFGTVMWSGDISASWETLRHQITEGLNFSMSGMPYWTLDIGAFFTVGSAWWKRGCGCSLDSSEKWFWNGDYNEGVNDLGYRELYVRWLEYGTFLPMFRSHGTDTPREIWNFGKKGEPFYDAIEKFIRLRYRLMPYIYSMAGKVNLNGDTILRSLLFDFADDENARDIDDEFMFGRSFLVCPVTEPMYFESESRPIEKEKFREVYLPAGAEWTDYWTGRIYPGGRTIRADAPLDRIPVFARCGSIIPETAGLSFADEVKDADITFKIYSGADADFALYEDEGDSYNYEKGAYSLIPSHWSDRDKVLTLKERYGSFSGMRETRVFKARLGGVEKSFSYSGEPVEIKF